MFILAFLAIGATGTLLTRKYLRRFFEGEPHWGYICSVFSNAVIVFFGLLLALITVAAYENYSHGFATAQVEANELSHMYGLTEALRDPGGAAVRSEIRSYVRCVVDREWSAQAQEDSPVELCRSNLNGFLHTLHELDLKSNKEDVAYGEILGSYGSLLDARRERLGQVDQTIPEMLWVVMYLGAFAMTATIFLLPVESKVTHVVISCVAAVSVALLIVVTAEMDNPFRGNLRVTPAQYENLENAFDAIDKGKFPQ
ncbi:DUF4239 domain-containing protein [Streptomyces sp. NPDC127084]|uniref:bestrophin-like domain n=1 Tax=Streptomyces sp. NPDC127084 TaxID=3347133 RepID=UPI0036577453